MPYNYLLDPKYRKGLKLDYANSVIILDEAHNIASCCEDVTSFNIRESDLLKVQLELQALEANLAMQGSNDKEWKSSAY